MQVKYPKLCPLTAAIVISGFSSFANAQLGLSPHLFLSGD
ncbi:hypothetical protein T635_3147 [Acinetobacter baumannii MRSN 7341]|nr:hypothetical protein T635_3147 [Acinetobacter baumannii MRSN 7341]